MCWELLGDPCAAHASPDQNPGLRHTLFSLIWHCSDLTNLNSTFPLYLSHTIITVLWDFRCISPKTRVLVVSKAQSVTTRHQRILCGWQCGLCRFWFSRRTQFPFLRHATHRARSVPLRSTVATLLRAGNDCRCARKPLVGMRRCEQETNKHYVFQSDWWVSCTPPESESSNPTCASPASPKMLL